MNANKHFLVVAYRYGMLNCSHYFVGCFNTYDEAVLHADKEAALRGGKYGVSVIMLNGYSTGEHLYHAPSIHNEKYPCKNNRIDLSERVGSAFISLVEQDTINKHSIKNLIKLVHREIKTNE